MQVSPVVAVGRDGQQLQQVREPDVTTVGQVDRIASAQADRVVRWQMFAAVLQAAKQLQAGEAPISHEMDGALVVPAEQRAFEQGNRGVG